MMRIQIIISVTNAISDCVLDVRRHHRTPDRKKSFRSTLIIRHVIFYLPQARKLVIVLLVLGAPQKCEPYRETVQIC